MTPLNSNRRRSGKSKNHRQLNQRQLIYGLLFVISLLCGRPPLFAATVPNGFSETVVAGSLTNPTAMAFAPDGRLFVCEQNGKLRVIKNGSLLANPFLTVSVNSSGERGLLGVAFDPNFSTNRFVYVYYTATSPAIHNRVSRFTANGDEDVPGSEVVILELNNLSGATNHNGGAIHFGLDGKLYIAVGDNATGSNSQTLSNLLGKILRINKDGTIPTDNPYYNTANGVNRAIWAMGLRNPFTMAFHGTSGRLFINDVGQNSWEEINDGIAGSNYAWPNSEGNVNCGGSTRCPVYAYAHGSSSTTGCAITGGTFYSPSTAQFPSDYAGDYFFADYCTGWIRKYDPSSGNVTGFASGLPSPVDLKVSSDGSLYYLKRGGGGAVYRIQYNASLAPSITAHPSDLIVSEGQPAVFIVAASGAAPLAYQWKRNGTNISGATSPTYTLSSAQMSHDGDLFSCTVSNSHGNVTSNDALLTVTSNNPPDGTITAPVGGSLYSAGTTINYSGTGTDPEDGNLPSSAFTWQVDFHHGTHVHPFIQPTSGSKTGSFTIPTTGHTETNVWYRIYLTVRDSDGLDNITFVEIVPRKADITISTNPSGLQIKLDDQPSTAPVVSESVVGIVRKIEAVTPQTVNGTAYSFLSWSDGGAVTHNISTPSTDTTYTALFNAQPSTSITSPSNGANFTAPANITINASASDSDGTIDKVEFFRGSTKLGEDSSSPYSFPWASVSAGSYNLTVRAIDDNGGTKTSNVVSITVNAANGDPSVSITNPANGANFTAPANITINASASDSDGTINKVEFFRGSTKLGEDSSSPYSFPWASVSAGSYNLTARATDNDGGNTTSSVVAITVNAANGDPSVSITNPANGANFTAPANITINASASDSDGTINKVEFFRGSTKLGEDSSSPYSFPWASVSAGSYNLTARATDNDGGNTTSSVVAITVNAANGDPSVSITNPANGANFTAPANITINASASDSDGTINKVEFFRGSTKLGEDSSSPYSFPWASVSAGSYNLTARATDDDGGSKTSNVVSITVDAANGTPAVSITSPANGATFVAPADITIKANASDSDGNITKVEFFRGSTKLGEDSSSPYSFLWSNASAGSFNLSARATDNDGETKTSSVVAITVNVGANAFMDEFNDGDLSNWSYEKGDWTERSGDLHGDHNGKATIFPTSFAGCSKCTIETQIMMGRPDGKVSLFGWYQDKKNNVELIMDEKKDRWIFKQKFNGQTLDKQKIALKIDRNKNYPVRITFNGSNFKVYVQNTLILTSPAGWSASGIVGLQIMNTSIAVERVHVK